jgi:hypothetical protein
MEEDKSGSKTSLSVQDKRLINSCISFILTTIPEKDKPEKDKPKKDKKETPREKFCELAKKTPGCPWPPVASTIDRMMGNTKKRYVKKDTYKGLIITLEFLLKAIKEDAIKKKEDTAVSQGFLDELTEEKLIKGRNPVYEISTPNVLGDTGLTSVLESSGTKLAKEPKRPLSAVNLFPGILKLSMTGSPDEEAARNKASLLRLIINCTDKKRVRLEEPMKEEVTSGYEYVVSLTGGHLLLKIQNGCIYDDSIHLIQTVGTKAKPVSIMYTADDDDNAKWIFESYSRNVPLTHRVVNDDLATLTIKDLPCKVEAFFGVELVNLRLKMTDETKEEYTRLFGENSDEQKRKILVLRKRKQFFEKKLQSYLSHLELNYASQ